MTRLRRILALTLCFCGIALGALAQSTHHDETVVWNFKNGLYVQGVPIGAAGATDANQVFTSTAPGQGVWQTLPDTAILGFNATTHMFTAVPPGTSTSVGSTGTLQASNGAAGFAAYAGSNQCQDPKSTAYAITSNGSLLCRQVTVGTFADRVWLAQPGADFPQGIALNTLPFSGLLTVALTNNVATPGVRQAPTGAVVGDTDTQHLTNKAVDPRAISLPTSTSPLSFDISTFDIGVASELNQDTQFANPTGTAVPGQEIVLQVHSTVVRAITWGNIWGPTTGTPLPTATSGGATDDFWRFQYNARIGKWGITYNSQLLIPAPASGVTAGPYTCPSSVTVNTQGLVTAITAGTCGGGGGGGGGGTGTPAGADMDVQLNSNGALGADSGNFLHDPVTHTTLTPNTRIAEGQTYQELSDTAGYTLFLSTKPHLTNDRSQQYPDEDGELCVKGGSCFTSLSFGDASTNTSTSVDGEIALFSGTGGKTLKRATGSGIAKVTSGVLSTVTAPSGAIVGDTDTQTLTNKRITKRVTTLTSSTTYTCPGDTSDQCYMAMTGSAGTLTVAAPTGTPVDGDQLILRFLCTNAQTFSWNTIFIDSPTVPRPTTCPAGTTTEFMVGVIYSGNKTKWQVIASN